MCASFKADFHISHALVGLVISTFQQYLSQPKITVMRWNEMLLLQDHKIVVQALFNPDFRSRDSSSFQTNQVLNSWGRTPLLWEEVMATNKPRSETSGRRSGWDCIEEDSSHGLYRCQKTWVQSSFSLSWLSSLELELCQWPEQLAREIGWIIVRSESWSKMRIEHCPKRVLDTTHL